MAHKAMMLADGVLVCERAYVLGGSVHSAIQLWQSIHGRRRSLIGIPKDAPYWHLMHDNGAEMVALAQYPLQHKVLGGAPGLTKMARQLFLIRATRVTTRLLKTRGIGLVHGNNSVTMNLPDLIAARLGGIPSICHIRRIHRLSFLDKWISRYVAGFIAVSQAAKKNYTDQGIDSDRIRVVYNSVPLDRFIPRPINEPLRRELELDLESPCIGVFTRLTPLKGVDVLLRSCALVRESGTSLQMLIAGGGPELHSLRQLATVLDIDSYVRFVGQVADVPAFLACCDIVAQPSLEPDAFPRSVIEAMAAGKPVIGSRTGGIPEAVVDNETGLLVSPGDVDELASALTTLLQDENRRFDMGVAARQEAVTRFSPRVFVKNIEVVYAAALTS